MTQVYRTLRVAPSDEGVLGVVIDAPPMNLIGPELVHDLVTLLSDLAEYTAEAARAGGPDDASLGMLWHKLSELATASEPCDGGLEGRTELGGLPHANDNDSRCQLPD